jgi:hypothetical protein
MKASRVTLIGLAGLAVLVASCSTAKNSGSPTTSTGAGSATTTPTVPTATVAQRFLSAATVVDVAYATWHGEVTGATQVSQITGPAVTYATALTTFDTALANLDAGGKAATDVPTLMSADRVVIGDLNSVTTLSRADLGSWARQLVADGAKAIQASDVVRADLGLPPS